MKRVFDIVASGFALILFLPVGLVFVVILRFTGEGEVFYRQRRVGRHGRDFELFKFATMLKDSPNLGTGSITQKDDPRVLAIGKFLRKTKLNEVPQLWNILIGDMSIVGPRPLIRESYEWIPAGIRNEIQGLQPGLSGIGSIIFRDEEALLHLNGEDPREFYRCEITRFKGELELWYKERKSLGLDLKVIFVTAWVVVFPRSQIVAKAFSTLPTHPLFNP